MNHKGFFSYENREHHFSGRIGFVLNDDTTKGSLMDADNVNGVNILKPVGGFDRPAGTYDLVFAKQTKTGEFFSVLGRFNNVTVIASETVQLEVDLTILSGS